MPAAPTRNRTFSSAIAIGLFVSVVTAAVMVTLAKLGVSPFPKPPSLAFAEIVLGGHVPLPVGLLFHAAYVTFWSVVFIKAFQRRTFGRAMMLAGILWIGVLLVFFPIFGWGLAGTAISPKLIPASLMPHVLFGVLLWLGDTYFPGLQNELSF